jgi:hypothetical protein
LLKKVEIDEGITFKPKLNTTEYEPRLGFHERNEFLLENKKQKIELAKKFDIDQFKSSNTYTKTDIEVICKEVEERLYRPGMKKQLQRQNILENQYSKTKKVSCLNENNKSFKKDNKETINSNQRSSNTVRYNFINDLNSD